MDMARTRLRLVLVTAAVLISCLFVHLVDAECECGYTTSVDDSPTPYLFTDILESDFLHLRNISLDTDWRRQNFTVSARSGRGAYGMAYRVDQIAANPILDAKNWTGPGVDGGDPGVRLVVGGGVPSDGFVPVAEMDSARTDLLWGSYRAAIRLTLVPGTCSSFFWYFNDSQEIDMEFLSSQFIPQNNTYPVNLVLQSAESVKAGFNAAATGNYIVANLPFNPTDGFHEYRIDFLPGSVIFYADGNILAKMSTSAVPSQPGHLVITQWSNGNPLWSFGPPDKEAVIAVSYVKAYFNSSDPARYKDWSSRCKNPSAGGAMCAIPDQIAAPNPATVQGNNSAASTYFFSDDKNKTINQTVYHENGVPPMKGSPAWTSSAMSLVALFILIVAFL